MRIVLVETTDALYEVDLALHVYRLVEHEEATGSRLLGAWLPYDRISPVCHGQPMRLFIALEDDGRHLHYKVVTTAPVTKVLAA